MNMFPRKKKLKVGINISETKKRNFFMTMCLFKGPLHKRYKLYNYRITSKFGTLLCIPTFKG